MLDINDNKTTKLLRLVIFTLLLLLALKTLDLDDLNYRNVIIINLICFMFVEIYFPFVKII